MTRADGTRRPRRIQARSQLTRARLIRAGAVEFARFGYENASTVRMCSEAGVSTGALYAHFNSKSALADQILARQKIKVDAAADHVREMLPDAFDRVLCFSSDLAELIVSDPEMQASIQLSTERSLEHPPSVWEQWATLANDLAATGQNANKICRADRPIGALLAAGLLGAWLVKRGEGEAEFEELLAHTWTALARSVVARERQASALASVRAMFGR